MAKKQKPDGTKRPRKVKAWAVMDKRGKFYGALPTRQRANDCVVNEGEYVIPVLITAAPTRVRGRRGK